MNFRKYGWAIGLCLVVSACSKSLDFSLQPATTNCDQGTCIVTIDVENTTAGELPLVYEISLSQNYIRDPDRSGLKVVGEANGEVNLSPHERMTFDVAVEVTEEPNGSKVTVFDSRTPKLLRSIFEPDSI